MKTHRSLAAIEADAAELKASFAWARIPAPARTLAFDRYEDELNELRAEWRAARAHDCEQYDGECLIS